MHLYLVQHGQPKAESEDSQRPLTDKGKSEVESVARHIANSGVTIHRIFHSGKLRARQTAELFAQYLAPAQGVAEKSGLGPTDEPGEAKRIVQQAEDSVMLVGHLPHLSRLASLLLLDNAEKEVISFKMGGVVCLGRKNEAWSVDWILLPEIAVRTKGNPSL